MADDEKTTDRSRNGEMYTVTEEANRQEQMPMFIWKCLKD